MFLRSLQYGIVVLGFLDAFVYAHHKHRLDIENAGNFDCMKGRVRLVTIITPAYALAYQTTCLAMHFLGVSHHTFRLPKPKSWYPYLPNVRSITSERGNDDHGWAIYTDGGTRVVDGETLAGWCVISRSPRGRIFVLFGPVITTEAHLAFSGARAHSNNSAEMTAMIEALSFRGPHGPVTHDEQSCIYYDSLHAAGICLGTIQARAHVQLALACQQSMIRAQRRLRLTTQHVYGHSGNLGNECADHAAALGTFGLTHSELYSELDNPIVMESLCYSANKGSKDAYDVSTSLTGYEPNYMTFGELNDSSVPFSFIIPSSDQDMDDVTLGKLLTAAHRGQVDYCVPGGMSVSQSSSSVMFDGSGQPDGERRSNGHDVRSATFLKTPNLRSSRVKQLERTD